MPMSWYWNDVAGKASLRAALHAGDERGDRHGNALTDVQRRLLPLGNAQLGIGERLGVADALDQVVGDRRDREEEVRALQAAQRIEIRWEGCCRPCPSGGPRRAAAAEALHDGADVALLVEIDLQQLDVDDDFRFRFVVRFDDLLGDAHLVGGVADGDGVERLEREDVARLDHGPDDVGDLLGVAVRQIEGADDEVFVVAAGLRIVGDDDDGVLVERFVEMIGGLHDALEGLLGGDVLQLDGDAVVLDGLVEEDVDAEGAAERFVDFLDRRLVRKRERDRLIGGRAELRRCGLGDVRLGAFLQLVDRGRLIRPARLRAAC